MSQTLRIERATGSITIKHHDAVIASSKRALVVRGERELPVFYVPKEDVYFEQLTEVGSNSLPDGRSGRFWSVTGSGGGVENAAWLRDETAGETADLAGHIGFDPAKISVEGL